MNYFWIRIYDYQHEPSEKDEYKNESDISDTSDDILFSHSTYKENTDWLVDDKGTLLDEYYLCGEELSREECKNRVKERSQVTRFAKPKKCNGIYAIVMDSSAYYYNRFSKEIDTLCFDCHKHIQGKAQTFPSLNPAEFDGKYRGSTEHIYFCSYDCKRNTIQKLVSPEGEWQDREGYSQSGVFGYIYHLYNRAENLHYIGQTKYMPFFRWQEHVKSGLKGNLCDIVFETIAEVKVRDQGYLNNIEAWWIQNFIKEYGRDRVMNLTEPKLTLDHLIEQFNAVSDEYQISFNSISNEISAIDYSIEPQTDFMSAE